MSNVSLPEGWRESYYNTETVDETYTRVTAVYEHLSIKVKTLIIPDSTPAEIREAGHTSHTVYYVYPVYEDLGLPWVFSTTCDELEDQIRSVVPEVKPRAGKPNKNAGPYATNSNNNPLQMIGGPRAAEGTFEWEDTLPEEAINAMETFKEFPLDYNIITDNLEVLSTADSLAMHNPDLLPNPFPLPIIVRQGNADEKFLQTDPYASSEFWDVIANEIDESAIQYHDMEEGTQVGTVHIEFQRDEFPYHPIIHSVDMPEVDDSPNTKLQNYSQKIRSTIWDK